MSGYIYAIAADNGLVKIGYTNQLRGRLSHLRANNCLKLSPLGYARGTREQEADLHRLLSAEHVRGEWFKRGRLTSAFLSMLATWPGAEPRLKTQPAATRADAIISRFGGKRAIAALLNVSPDAVKQWKQRGDIPGKWHLTLLKLARERGIDLSSADLIRMAA